MSADLANHHSYMCGQETDASHHPRVQTLLSESCNCADQIVKQNCTNTFLASMILYKENSAVLIRIAFVLGNLTTHYTEARTELCQNNDCFKKVIGLAQFYLEKDLNGIPVAETEPPKDKKIKKYEQFSAGNLEDAITKVVKLIANLSTEETYAHKFLMVE